MRRWTGFTVVELVVVMVIMAILLTLAGFTLNRSQGNSRDAQRNADIAIIARGLETRYKEGNPKSGLPSYVAAGSYPDVDEMAYILGNTVSTFTPTQVSGGYSNDALPGTSVANFTPPGVTGPACPGFVIATCTTAGSCASAGDSGTSGSTTGSSTPVSQFYYEPIDANGNICKTTTCVRFNLYWKTEVDNTSHILRSNHQ